MRYRTAGVLVVTLLILLILVLLRTLRFGWSSFGISMVPFLLENLIPIVNFGVLLLVIIGLQVVREDLKQRLSRLERVEAKLTALELEMATQTARVFAGTPRPPGLERRKSYRE
jgi:hypothetical protein